MGKDKMITFNLALGKCSPSRFITHTLPSKECQGKTNFEIAEMILHQEGEDHLLGYLRESWQFVLKKEVPHNDPEFQSYTTIPAGAFM